MFSSDKLIACVASVHSAVSQEPNDVCGTPAPSGPGPVPVPYPKIAISSTPGPGFTTRTLAIATSEKGKSGDQRGVALGIVSNRMCAIVMASTVVKVRALDKSLSNG